MRQIAAIRERISPATILLAAVVILGILLRFLYLGDIRHGYDEGYPAYDALRLLDGGQWLLSGQPSSVFLDNPPLMAYLQAIPLLFWRSLWSVYIFVTALNALAVWFLYGLTNKLLGEKAALLAAFLFAASPWVVHFSRLPWVQGLLPLFTVLIAWGLWPMLVTKTGRQRQVFIAMLAVTATIQSYILGLAILLPVAVLIILYRSHIPKRPLYAGLAILLASLALFAAGLSLNESRNVTKLEEFVSDNEITVRSQALEHAVRFVTGLDYEGQSPAGEELLPRQALSRGVHILLSLALAVGGLRALLALRRGGQARRLAVVLLIWFLAPVLGLLFLPYLVHPHYLMLSLPAGHVLAAWGILPLLDNRRWRPAVILALLVVGGVFWLNLERAGQAVKDSPSGFGFNRWALADVASIGVTVRDLATGDSHPRRVAAEANSPLLSGISATYADTMPELAYPDYLVLPGQDPLLYVLINNDAAASLAGPHLQTFPERTIQTADGTSVSFLRVAPYDRQQALALPQTVVDWHSDAGLTLLGYSLETEPPYNPDHPLVLITYWRVEELHPDRAEWLVAPFFQVLNAQWQIVANVGPDGQWGYRWLVGDVYVHRTTVTLPEYVQPGLHQLAIGLFDPLQGTSFSLNSPAGSEPFYLAPLPVGE